MFVDDDIRARPDGWRRCSTPPREHPEVDVFTGPISARLEGAPPRSCGREGAADHDARPRRRDDTDTRFAWGANMAIRRSALERVGPFDVSLEHGGDEQEWQERLRAARRAARALMYVRRRAPSSTAARAPTRACASLVPRRLRRAGAPRGASTRARGDAPSLAARAARRSPAASATCCAAAAPPG